MTLFVALLPVLLFLAVLFAMDSFKLLRWPSLAASLAYGGVAAFAVLYFHRLLPLDHVSAAVITRYVAPVTEEIAKALLPVFLLRTHRVGFLVDALVLGFAVGAGFSLVENAMYWRALDAPIWLWIVRGFGTAMLHGACTGIFATLAKAFSDRQGGSLTWLGAPLGAAIVIHSAFNHVLLPPAIQFAFMLLILPGLVLWVFERSERATREWIGAGLDLDVELLNLVASDAFAHTRFGTYLRELQTRFPSVVVADMFCLLRLELELSAQAKGRVLARQAGLPLPVDSDLHDALDEREYLQSAIGPTGLRALEPLQITTHRDHWHRHVLRQR
jgi:RsiW-degrading membrane proteinase PrsW (M82 family)